MIKEHEEIFDLECEGLKIIQSAKGYAFTTDAVLLANTVRAYKKERVVELGAGSAVISLLLSKKTPAKEIIGIEVQPRLADMATRSVALNNLQDVIQVVNCDLKSANTLVGGKADVVVCNPPYRKVGSGEQQIEQNLAICRHEICATLADIIQSASKCLNNRGNLYLVHQARRTSEIVALCAQHKIAVKEILPVCPSPNRQPNLVLVRGVEGGESDCILHAPMYITDENGNYTPQAKAYYGLTE